MIDGQPLACFQPFIDTATGRIAGVEALGRLRQADGRLESVGPLFADPRTPSVILRRLDRQIRDDALRRLHEAPEDWFLSLNISPRWINRLRPGQPLPSLKQIHSHGVDPQRIVFEITERDTVKNLSLLERFLSELKLEGFKLAIDDFGSGFSSFHYLRRFPIDFLKIEGDFIANMLTSPKDRAVVTSIKSLAQEMGITIVAEYVESQEVLDELHVMGVHLAQGYYVGKPARHVIDTDWTPLRG